MMTFQYTSSNGIHHVHIIAIYLLFIYFLVKSTKFVFFSIL